MSNSTLQALPEPSRMKFQVPSSTENGPSTSVTTTDASANRVLTKGEAIAPPAGRADDFSWPRGTAATEPLGNDPAELAGTAPLSAGKTPAPTGQRAAENASQNGQPAAGDPKRQRRAPRQDFQRPFSFQNMFRW